MKKRILAFILMVGLIGAGIAPLAQATFVSAISIAPLAQVTVYTGYKSQIDATNKDDAYIRVRYFADTTKKLKVKITKDDISYTYDLNNDKQYEVFSLQSGSGSYTVKVLENITDNRYSVVQKVTLEVKYTSPYAPFLIPIQNINYNEDSQAVKLAEQLTRDSKTDLEKVRAIYQYVVGHITYDSSKAKQIASGTITTYNPSIDVILDTGKGICFDYSSLLAAMLRSQGIPAKMIFGYVAPNNLYHAWNEVYTEQTGWIKINSSIYFDGKSFSRMDPTFSAANASGNYTAFIGNASNYTIKYQY